MIIILLLSFLLFIDRRHTKNVMTWHVIVKDERESERKEGAQQTNAHMFPPFAKLSFIHRRPHDEDKNV